MYPADLTVHAIAVIDSANMKDAVNVHKAPPDSVSHTAEDEDAPSPDATKEHEINSSVQRMEAVNDATTPNAINPLLAVRNFVHPMEGGRDVQCKDVINLLNHLHCTALNMGVGRNALCKDVGKLHGGRLCIVLLMGVVYAVDWMDVIVLRLGNCSYVVFMGIRLHPAIIHPYNHTMAIVLLLPLLMLKKISRQLIHILL